MIDLAHAAENVPPGDPKLSKGDTIYLSVIDKDRNCCSLIQSNYYGFGSEIVPGDVGFVLQNRGTTVADVLAAQAVILGTTVSRGRGSARCGSRTRALLVTDVLTRPPGCARAGYPCPRALSPP